MRAALALPLLAACGREPDPCEAMCEAATEVYTLCVEQGTQSWYESGYEGPRDFADACETWAWEQRLLEDDAVRRGEDGARGRTEAACRDRAQILEAEEAECDDYTKLDWQDPL